MFDFLSTEDDVSEFEEFDNESDSEGDCEVELLRDQESLLEFDSLDDTDSLSSPLSTGGRKSTISFFL